MSNKLPLIGVGVVAVAAIAYFAVAGWPPTGDKVDQNVGGTIGAAERYTSSQMKTEDVAVNESEVQALMQTDVFHKMITNEDFRKAVLAEQWKSVASDPATLGLLATPEAQAFFADETNRQLIEQGGLARADIEAGARALIENANYRSLIFDENARAVMQSESFKTFVAEAQKAGWTPEEFQKQLIENAKLSAELNKSVAYKTLIQDAQGKAFAEMALKPEIGKVLADANAMQKLVELGRYNMEQGRQSLIESGRMAVVMRNDIYQFGRNPSVQALWRSNPEAAKAVFEDATFQKYAASDAVQRLAADDGLRAKYEQM
jgi:hypothetical protein